MKTYFQLNRYLKLNVRSVKQSSPRAHAPRPTYPLPHSVRRPTGVGHAGREQADRAPQGQGEDPDQETLEPGRRSLLVKSYAPNESLSSKADA